MRAPRDQGRGVVQAALISRAHQLLVLPPALPFAIGLRIGWLIAIARESLLQLACLARPVFRHADPSLLGQLLDFRTAIPVFPPRPTVAASRPWWGEGVVLSLL